MIMKFLRCKKPCLQKAKKCMVFSCVQNVRLTMNATKAFKIRQKMIADTQKAYQCVKNDRIFKEKNKNFFKYVKRLREPNIKFNTIS